ncbi:MAG: hypothetical protein HUU35_09570, partial [Armatimonadetes bacterium]|nr:hypothetical protein [Armatimonadota bacterium]
ALGAGVAAPLPVMGISSLETLAAAAPLNERQPVCAVIAAPKRHLYCALYARRSESAFNCLFGPDLLPVEQLAERIEATGQRVAVAGLVDEETGSVLHHAGASLLPAVHGVPRAAVAAWLGWHRLGRGERHDLATLTPQYVHPSEAEVRFGRTFARPSGPDADD